MRYSWFLNIILWGRHKIAIQGKSFLLYCVRLFSSCTDHRQYITLQLCVWESRWVKESATNNKTSMWCYQLIVGLFNAYFSCGLCTALPSLAAWRACGKMCRSERIWVLVVFTPCPYASMEKKISSDHRKTRGSVCVCVHVCVSPRVCV